MKDDTVLVGYLRTELPVVLTLGALVVFNAAQQDRIAAVGGVRL